MAVLEQIKAFYILEDEENGILALHVYTLTKHSGDNYLVISCNMIILYRMIFAVGYVHILLLVIDF